MYYSLFQIYWQKIHTIWLTFVSLRTVWPWKSSQSHRSISILSCLKVVFLLILLQSSHWSSRYNIDNLWRYYICLDFAVSVILWPYEVRSRLQNQFHFFLKCIHINSFTIHWLDWGIIISLKFGSLSPNVTLKNRSGSCKLNQLLIVYTHISLVRIHQLVQKKPGTQMSVMPMQMLM